MTTKATKSLVRRPIAAPKPTRTWVEIGNETAAHFVREHGLSDAQSTALGNETQLMAGLVMEARCILATNDVETDVIDDRAVLALALHLRASIKS